MTYNYDRRTAAESMGAKEFVEALQAHLQIKDRQAYIRISASWGPKKEDDVYVNFINLPKGVGGAGGGAEAENNRMSFWIRDFGVANAPPPSGKVKVEMSNSALPREYRLRAKSGPPQAVAQYLAGFLNKVVAEVPPVFTHTGPDGLYKYKV